MPTRAMQVILSENEKVLSKLAAFFSQSEQRLAFWPLVHSWGLLPACSAPGAEEQKKCSARYVKQATCKPNLVMSHCM